MENSTTTRQDYRYIAVPTNLFIALDTNLRNALTVLLHLTNVFGDAEGYFFRTNEDLQKSFKMGKNLTIAVLESLYRHGLISVKSVGFTKKGGKRQVNFYRVNVEKFKEFEKYDTYTITNVEELQMETVNYKAKDFHVTYTASTSTEDTNEGKNTSVSPSNVSSEEIPSQEVENAAEAKEMASKSNEIVPSEPQKKEEVKEEVKTIEMDGEVIETASVFPSNFSFKQVEKRNANVSTSKLDEKAKAICEDLVERYIQMKLRPRSNESIEKCNAGFNYIIRQYKEGRINLETKDRLTRKLISASFTNPRY